MTLNSSGISISGPVETGVGLSAAGQSASAGVITLSNSNNVSFGMAGSVVTATATFAGGAAQSIGVSTGGNTLGNTGTYSGQVVFAGGNNITLSVGTAAGGAQTITISGANAGGAQTGISGIIVSNTTYTSGTVSFSNANGITFGSSAGQAITASYNSTQFAGTGTSITGNASITLNSNGIAFNGSGLAGTSTGAAGASVTLNSSGISLSVTQSNQAVSAQGGSSAFQTLVFTNSNNVSFSNTGGSVWGSYALNVSAGAGTSNALSGITFANSNSITFGLSTGVGVGTMTASVSYPAQTNQTLSLAATSNTAGNTSGMSVDARSLTLAGYGNASVGFSTSAGGSSVIISVTTAAQTAQTIGLYASSQTTAQSSSSTVDARSLTIVGQGNISVGLSAGSFIISQTGGGGGLTTGGFYALGNTTQNSSTTLALTALSFNALGAMTMGYSNSSIQVSAPQTSNLSATGNASISTNGQTISIGANAAAVSISGNSTSAGAGYSNISTGTAIFAGGNNITLSQNGASITISGANVGGAQTGISSVVAAGGTQTAGEISFINSNNVSFGMSTGAVTGSITASYALNVSAGAGTSNALSAITFANSNSITFGLSTGAGVGTLTASVSYPAQTNQQMTLYATSNTTQSSTGTTNASSVIFAGAGAVSVGITNGSVVVSAPNTIAQTNQTLGLYASSQTTAQSSSSTVDARSLTIVGQGNISVGLSAGSFIISQTGGGGGGFELSAGASSQSTGTIVFSNSNNVTFGMSTNAAAAATVTASASFPAQTNQTIGAYATGANTTAQSSSTTFDARSLSISGAGIVSAGMSTTAAGAPVLVISATTAAQTNQTLSWAATSNTSGNTSGMTVDARSLTIAGYGNISVGMSTSAGGSTLVFSAATAAGLTTGGFYALGNTTQNSSTTLPLTAMSFNGLGAMTVGYNNSSIQLSAPNTSSLVGSNGISISTNGSTISIIDNPYTQSWFAPEIYGNTLTSAHANGTLYLRPFELDGAMNINQVIFQQSLSSISSTLSISASVSAGNASSGTGSWGQSGTVLLFSRLNTNATNASFGSIQTFNSTSYTVSAGYSLSVSWSTNASSATASWTTSAAVGYINNIGSNGAITTTAQTQSGSSTFSSTSTNANSFSSSYGMSFVHPFLTGLRPLFIPHSSGTVAPNEYYIGIIQSTATGSTNYAELTRPMVTSPVMLYFTASSNNYLEIGNSVAITTSNYRNGFGSYSSSGNTTTAIALSQISQMASNASLYFALDGYTK